MPHRRANLDEDEIESDGLDSPRILRETALVEEEDWIRAMIARAKKNKPRKKDRALWALFTQVFAERNEELLIP